VTSWIWVRKIELEDGRGISYSEYSNHGIRVDCDRNNAPGGYTTDIRSQLDEITLADILGSPAIEESVEDKKLKEKRSWENRFYRILITESAHLIWKIRCNRVIQNEGELATANEVRNKWLAAINIRLELDRKMTNPKYEKKALKKEPGSRHLERCAQK